MGSKQFVIGLLATFQSAGGYTFIDADSEPLTSIFWQQRKYSHCQDCVLLPGWVPFTYSAPHNCVRWVGANYDARPGLFGVGGWWPQLALPPSEP